MCPPPHDLPIGRSPPAATAAPSTGSRRAAVDPASSVSATPHSPAQSPGKSSAPAALFVAADLAGGLYWRSHRTAKLTEKDTIVLADFSNTTGDPVFDESLKRALAVSLQQSPFLSLLSDEQVQQTLRMMNRPATTLLSRDVASEICQRNSAKASAYRHDLFAGRPVPHNRGSRELHQWRHSFPAANAAAKEKVLQALGEAASDLRTKLGESLASVQKYDTPLEAATTSSLEALRAFSLGVKAFNQQGSNASIPFFKRAIDLDPNFAIAYGFLAIMYGNIGKTSLAMENAQRAYWLATAAARRARRPSQSQQLLDHRQRR